MELLLERKYHFDHCTAGNLYVDGKWFCHTIEDKVRAKPNLWQRIFKVYGKTAIPYGRYRVLVTWSNRFKRLMPAVLNVPDFEGIRIHNGTSELSTEGCIIVSYRAATNTTLVNDRTAMNDLTILIERAQKTGKVWLTITDKKP